MLHCSRMERYVALERVPAGVSVVAKHRISATRPTDRLLPMLFSINQRLPYPSAMNIVVRYCKTVHSGASAWGEIAVEFLSFSQDMEKGDLGTEAQKMP